MKNSTPQLLHQVTRQLTNGQANVTLSAWKESLQRHPQYPSMQSLADTLQRWGFDNAALRLVPEQLAELPYPYIAHFRDQGGKFVGVLDRKNDELRVTDGLKESWIELASFAKSWSGAILLMELKEKNGDPEYAQKRKVEILQSLRLPVLCSAVAILVLSTLLLSPALTLPAISYVGLSLGGLGLSIALVSLHLDGKNSPAQKLCHTSDTTDCHSVLDSPAATLFGLFSLAEFGMLFFGFELLFLLAGIISRQVAATMSILAGVSFLATLYVPYSLYYQARVIRQWCRFCLGVQAVLVLQAIVGLAFDSFSWASLVSFPYIPFLWGVTFPVMMWLVVKPYWIGVIKGSEASRNLRRFQSNEKLFADMLEREQSMMPVPCDVPVFRFGNPDAPNTLTIVTNPYCAPCAATHDRIDKLLLASPFVKAEAIVLTGDSGEDKRTRVAAHWLSLSESGTNLHKAMSDWYRMSVKDHQEYSRHYPNEITTHHLERVLPARDWAIKAQIDSTPTIYLNGKAVPDLFRIEDLEYFLMNKVQMQVD